MHYYCAYLLLRVVRTSSLRCSTIFVSSPASLLGLFGSLFSQFQTFLIFRACFSFSIIACVYLSLSPLLPPVVSHGRRGFPQAHSVRLAYHEEREEETKERIEFRFAVEAVAVTRSKRRRRRRTTTSTIKTTTRTTRTTTESLRPIRLAENASASRAPAFEVVVV